MVIDFKYATPTGAAPEPIETGAKTRSPQGTVDLGNLLGQTEDAGYAMPKAKAMSWG